MSENDKKRMKLITSQAKKAVAALKKYYEERPKNDLLGSEEPMLLELTTKKIKPKEKQTLKLTALPLKHSCELDTVDICLIVKELDETAKQIKKQVSQVREVIKFTSLEQEYKTFEAKRKLAKSYDLFLVDDRVLPYMSKFMGKSFFAAGKIPIPVKITNPSKFQEKVNTCLKRAYTKEVNSSSRNIKFAHTGMTVKEIMENFETVLPAFVETIPFSWRNVQEIAIRLPDTPSLPVYNSLPDESDDFLLPETGKKEKKSASPAPAASAPEVSA